MSDLANLANQNGRSIIAVIDMMTQRGAIKGEELSTIGRLRDQTAQMIQLAEEELMGEDDSEEVSPPTELGGPEIEG